MIPVWYGCYRFDSLRIIGYVCLVHSDATLSLCGRKPDLGWLLTVEVFMTLLSGVISSKGDVPIPTPKLDASSMEVIKSMQLSEQPDRMYANMFFRYGDSISCPQIKSYSCTTRNIVITFPQGQSDENNLPSDDAMAYSRSVLCLS